MSTAPLTVEIACHTAHINALRRTILADLPVLVCRRTDCVIAVNTSRYMSNEILSERLASIPLHSQSPELIGASVVLNVTNKTKDLQDVTSEQLELVDAKGMPLASVYLPRTYQFSDGTVRKGFNLLTTLRPGEEINLRCPISKAERCGESGQYCVASTCTYWCVRDSVAAEAAYEALPDEEKSLERKMNWNMLEANRYVVPNKFMFSVQSCIPSVLSNRQIIASACHTVIERLESTVAISREKATETTMPNCTDIILKETDYTIGKLLENQILADGVADYVTFFKKHPHDVHGILRVAMKSDKQVGLALKACIEPLKQVFLKIAEGQGQTTLHPKLQEALAGFKRSTVQEKQTRLQQLGVPKEIVLATDEDGLDGMAKSYLSNKVEQSVIPSLRKAKKEASLPDAEDQAEAKASTEAKGEPLSNAEEETSLLKEKAAKTDDAAESPVNLDVMPTKEKKKRAPRKPKAE